MTETELPASFDDLELFVEYWARETQTERLHQRLAAKRPKIRAFYDAITPRLKAILDHLDQFPITAELPADAERLRLLAMAAAQIAPAVELFKQPAVVCGFDARLFLPTHEPVPRRPKMSIAPQSFV
jgi:hypothetical protein